ncbi:phosphatase PAP2 family protein [Guyparkeria halophila]|uniref:undecaprenyl-diphosphate phosphatase n=1 Tax=Guyparkeria halophila TaxID=47960 RepID=A0ABZ0YX17_9GAMM|nr:phosphatase PAP2 family protein [Guyparkeria halophila]WQH16581.1 phosphatase PAP2 family protein [Guyparkeria halophila]
MIPLRAGSPAAERCARVLQAYLGWEALVTERCNRAHRLRVLRALFATASRLGDGIGWYVLALLMLVLHGASAVVPMALMIASGGVGVLIYLTIKRRTARLRPLNRNQRLEISVAPLDQYSFPSGHTLHAVNFGIQLVAFQPALFWLVLPFALLVASSRMVLGLHYLSDVLVGAAIGLLLASLTLSLL